MSINNQDDKLEVDGETNMTEVEQPNNNQDDKLNKILVPENFLSEFDNDTEDTTETVPFIPNVSYKINRNQEKYDLYDKIFGMLSISKYSDFLIYIKEKIPYKQDYLFKKVVGVRVIKEVDIPSTYEHHGLFADGPSDITIDKIKTYEKVYVEVKITNPDSTDAKWVICDDLSNIMVKSVGYSLIQ